MKKITETELKSILEQHKLWFECKGGKCANLCGTDLRGAYLSGADLSGANLTSANLTSANLTDAELRWSDLRDADLRCAKLTGAYLTGANLTGACLYGADLTGTILEKKAEDKPSVISSAKSESSTRQALEQLAKEHGFKIDSISLSFI